MSVCFFVPADQAGPSTADDDKDNGSVEEVTHAESQQQTLEQFWGKIMDDVRNVSSEDFKTQALPLARIKKIMKLDEEVKMISAEAPVLFAKAAEIFIHELSLRAWSHTEDNKRRTLQRNDIAMAISLSDQFDFLIDIVPRHEVKSAKIPSWTKSEPTTEHTSVTTSSQPQIVVQSCAQLSQPAAQQTVQQPVTLLQQLVTPNGEVQNVPSQIQLTQAQLNLIRLQVQNNPTQPIIIQTQQQQSPQIIQVTSQAQHQPQQHVYLAQVATSQDDS